MASIITDRSSGGVGLAFKAPVRVATTASITLAGFLTIDGILLEEDDRVLVKDQSSGIDNGIYRVKLRTWERAPDFDGYNDVTKGTLVLVQEGTINADKLFEQTTADAVIGVSSLVFVERGLAPEFPLSQASGGTGATSVGAATVTPTGGTSARSIADLFAESLSVKDFGAIGNGVADDTTAISSALSTAISANKRLRIPSGTYKITSSIAINAIGVVITGDGVDASGSVLKASGNFGQILELQSGSAEVFIEGIRFETTGTTTRCITITRGLTPHFEDCAFKGDLTGSLVYSTGDICQWSACIFQCDSANTVGLEFDEHNQNCSVDSNTRFGGVGLGIKVSKSGSGPRVEGLKLDNVFFINTGAYNVEIGDSFFTSITGCPLDQATTYALRIHGGASKVQVNGGWFNGGSTGIGIKIEADAGDGHSIVNATCYGGNTGIQVAATASNKVQHVLIDGVMFDAQNTQALSLDSVTNCRIVNCIDRGTPSSGSWITSGTHATKGSYIFDNNSWHTTAPATFDTASTYKWGNDTGIVMKATGLQSGIGTGVTSVAVTHGLSRTPTKILATPLYATSTGAWFVHTIGATTFTIQWPTATPNSNCTFAWQAEVA